MTPPAAAARRPPLLRKSLVRRRRRHFSGHNPQRLGCFAALKTMKRGARDGAASFVLSCSPAAERVNNRTSPTSFQYRPTAHTRTLAATTTSSRQQADAQQERIHSPGRDPAAPPFGIYGAELRVLWPPSGPRGICTLQRCPSMRGATALTPLVGMCCSLFEWPVAIDRAVKGGCFASLGSRLFTSATRRRRCKSCPLNRPL